jgi:membrane protein
MAEESTTADGSGSSQAREHEQTGLRRYQLETPISTQQIRAGSRVRALRDTGTTAVARVGTGAPGRYWSRLTAVDFLNSSFAFAALGVICAFPFLAVISAASGGDVRHVIVVRMGLNARATREVNALISPGHHAVTTLTVFSGVLLLLGAIGMASTLQAWYHRIYEQPPSKGVLTRVAYQLVGVVAFSVYIAVDVLVLDAVRPDGGPGLVFLLTFVFATLFWWCSAYFLLFGRVAWRKLLPAGVATAFCITGLGVFSWLLFSEEIISGQKSYGPAGVVLALTSYLVGFGVCLHLGAVFGRMWNDWRASARGQAATGTSEAPRQSHRE